MTFIRLRALHVRIPHVLRKATKLSLAAFRLAWALVTGREILHSADHRVRNATMEELGPLGRADAPPSAKDKNAPDMLHASAAVLTELQDAKKTLAKIETARAGLEAANAALAGKPHDPALQEAVREAKRKLELTFAKLCHQIDVKAGYKAASEASKVEFVGNQRYFAASYMASFLTTGAGWFAIMAPLVGGAATGGVSTAAAVLAPPSMLAIN